MYLEDVNEALQKITTEAVLSKLNNFLQGKDLDKFPQLLKGMMTKLPRKVVHA